MIKINKKVKLILIVLISFFTVVFILDRAFPLPAPKPYSKVILSDEGILLNAYLSRDDKWRLRTSLDEVSPELIKAIIEKEDKMFYMHCGVNPVAVFRALITNIFRGRIVSGASTITMQVSRLLSPVERSYSNKIIEMFRAVQLELHYSKREILEIYLSLLPYGGNIEGVTSASYLYFDRSPDRLSLAQAITLAVIPNDPGMLRIDRAPNSVRKKRNTWIKKYIKSGTFPKKDLNDALDEPLVPARYSFRSKAPHFCLRLAAYSKDDIILTTLKMKIQQTAEELLINHIRRVNIKGVSNGAVLIIDNKTASVVAYCGSADFGNERAQGQVDGVKAVRSPGSTLKAALYAHTFDNGILTPKMRLLDVPTDFSGYEPENYSLKFNGSVTAEYALLNSLNIPAVRLLGELGIGDFISLLERAGFESIKKNKSKLGLSMILGGCGATLEQLTSLFSAFAHEGILLNPAFIEGDTSGRQSFRLFSAGSSFIIGQILSDNTRPDFPNELLGMTRLPRIAWKTGTSYGKRDAWAIGFNPRFTIGVWLGNFDGRGSPHLSGSEMAVPLLFDLFNSIDYDSEKRWFKRPKEVAEREVCAETGLLPSSNCSNITTDYYIKNISPNKTCDLYKEIFVSCDESVQYCTECLPPVGYKKKLYPIYDPELTLWFSTNNIEFIEPPPHNPNCQARFSGEGPKIISPSQDFEYLIEKGSGQEILLQAASAGNIKIHYWYINDRFYKKCKPGDRVFFKPESLISSGKKKIDKIKISCLDDKGREMAVFINFKFY